MMPMKFQSLVFDGGLKVIPKQTLLELVEQKVTSSIGMFHRWKGSSLSNSQKILFSAVILLSQGNILLQRVETAIFESMMNVIHLFK